MYQAPSLVLIVSSAYEMARPAAANPSTPQTIRTKASFISVPHFT